MCKWVNCAGCVCCVRVTACVRIQLRVELCVSGLCIHWVWLDYVKLMVFLVLGSMVSVLCVCIVGYSRKLDAEFEVELSIAVVMLVGLCVATGVCI